MNKIRGLRKEFTTMKRAKKAKLLTNRDKTLFYWYSEDNDSWAIFRPSTTACDFPDVGDRVPVYDYNNLQFVGYACIQYYLTAPGAKIGSALIAMDTLSSPISLL